MSDKRMLPQTSSNENAGKNTAMRTIYVNPNFSKMVRLRDTMTAATTTTMPHINPLFLQGAIMHNQQKPTISKIPNVHMNPAFLQKKLMEQQMKYEENLRQQQKEQEMQRQKELYKMQAQMKKIQLEKELEILKSKNIQTVIPSKCSGLLPKASSVSALDKPRKIITQSRMCIVREPATTKQEHNPTIRKVTAASATAFPTLVCINKRKLIRKSATPNFTSAKVSAATKPTTFCDSENKLFSIGKYKLYNKRVRTVTISNASPLVKVRRRAFVARYALRRGAAAETLQMKHDKSNTAQTSVYKPNSAQSLNRKLQLLNINGVLYKSTRNKLQRKDDISTNARKLPISKDSANMRAAVVKSVRLPQGRALFVHGTKFIMDTAGFKLTRVPGTSTTLDNRMRAPQCQRQRIDIGGLTYVASKTQNVFVCTRNHLARAHLNSAKQRSLQVLSKRLAKSNIPCAIYQRLGKCLAFERGTCSKVHDKKHVIICPSFLRGECLNANCLLSHNVTLAKMPVCKFFLQAVCVREDCPYLHKKLGATAEICSDFLSGFCKLAEQCHKRHEFLCPNFERTGKCEIKNCIYCKSKKRQQQRQLEQQQQQQQLKKQKRNIIKEAIVMENNQSKNDVDDDVQENNTTTPPPLPRYFEDKSGRNLLTREEATAMDTINESVNHNDDDDEDESIDEMRTTLTAVRPKIGALPSYIPLT